MTLVRRNPSHKLRRAAATAMLAAAALFLVPQSAHAKVIGSGNRAKTAAAENAGAPAGSRNPQSSSGSGQTSSGQSSSTGTQSGAPGSQNMAELPSLPQTATTDSGAGHVVNSPAATSGVVQPTETQAAANQATTVQTQAATAQVQTSETQAQAVQATQAPVETAQAVQATQAPAETAQAQTQATTAQVQTTQAAAAQTTAQTEQAPAEQVPPVQAQTSGVITSHGEPRVVTTTLFDGGELMMLSPDAASQMMSFLITTKSGKLIAVDGGTENETAHLIEMIRKKGGVVHTWLITHPHSDHVGALTEILKQGASSGVTIQNIYYNFAPLDWYYTNENYRAQMVADCLAALGTINPAANHPGIKKGEVIQVDDVRITVMNEPYLFSTNAINNSSVAFRVEMNGKRILFLGDMGVQAGRSLLAEYQSNRGELKADIVQMAHHGESGVDENIYQAIQPSFCLWCCPEWLWNNDKGTGTNSGPWKTIEVRGWMRTLGVKTHVVEKDGDQVLR